MTILLIIASAKNYIREPFYDNLYDTNIQSLVLYLSGKKCKQSVNTRIQFRKLRSTRLGKISINYECGTTVNGSKVVPEDLTQMVAPGMNFSYDTIFTVTEMRYLQQMQRREIQERIFQENGFYISTGSISELSQQGLAYLEQCHFNRSKELAEYYRKNCFIIHLDGTNEGGLYNHFVVRDGITSNVLYAKKIVSESETSIRAILVKIKTLFGIPDAVISDMSAGIIKAVKSEMPDVPHRLCHFHFLKAVGVSVLGKYHRPAMISVKRMKKMLSAQRLELKTEFNLLQQSSSTKKRKACQWMIDLIDYIRDYEKDMSGEGFPFDLPAIAFYERSKLVFDILDKIMTERSRHLHSLGKTGATLCFIRNRIQEFMSYNRVNQIRNLNDIFMELRNIIHPKSATEVIPLNWGMVNSDTKVKDITEQLKTLQSKATRFTKRKHKTYQTKAWKIVKSRLVKYNEALNPVIAFRKGEFILPRTNNLSETGFRDCKRQARRTTGMKNLSRYMDNLPPQYFYTFNLQDQDYIKTVFGDREIFDRFYSVDRNIVKSTVNKIKEQRLSPKQINHKLIRRKEFITQFTNHFMLEQKTQTTSSRATKRVIRRMRRKKAA